MPGGCLMSSAGCDCACAAANDKTREYDIIPLSANVVNTPETLWDGSTQTIPESSFWPNTSGGGTALVNIDIPKAGSAMEFGTFQSNGTASWYPIWRILAHELCAHGVLGLINAGPPGNRPAHDATIDVENQIAAEHGEPIRGRFADKPRQGETFFNPTGNRTKVGFFLMNGLHFEPP